MPIDDYLPAEPATATSGAEVGYNQRERTISGELALYDSHWAGLFEAGLALVPIVRRPGNVYLLAHAGRELTRAVVHRLAYHPYRRIARLTTATEPPALLAPAEAELHASALAEDATGVESERRDGFKDVIAAALELDRDHPTVDAWFRVYDRLVSSVHINPVAGARGPDPDDVVAAFLGMSELIYGRLAPYFDTQRALDALLAIEHPA